MPSLRSVRSRICLICVSTLAFLAMGAVLVESSGAATGGLGSAPTMAQASKRLADRYDRLYYGNLTQAERRWASKTSWCESGHNPRAVGGGGRYRGAFMFLLSSWAISPKTPGGDPIRYSYRTQAVVAVMLKRKMGTRPWPVCG
ncbi:MAG: hypothetical protein U0R52_07420 [Solirubrobacterales bacterium]